MKEYLSIANSKVMAFACGIVIIYVLGQSLFFMRRAWKRGKEIGMDTKVMKSTVSGSALFSIVPSIPILIILVMLMSVLGNYFPWLRLSVIGSSSYENVAANIAARSFGLLSYTDEGYNATIFISTLWAMSICILYEPLLVMFGQKSLDKGMGKLRKNKPVIYNLLIDGIFIAMMGWFLRAIHDLLDGKTGAGLIPGRAGYRRRCGAHIELACPKDQQTFPDRDVIPWRHADGNARSIYCQFVLIRMSVNQNWRENDEERSSKRTGKLYK
ncbi:MAG: DUF5058 family protein [Coprococcus sp.]|nr:DUF5058 family protein [Coprococcus sp.]